MSGGEHTRIGLAGVLAHRPRLAILDGPTARIDLLSMVDIVALIDELVPASRVCS